MLLVENLFQSFSLVLTRASKQAAKNSNLSPLDMFVLQNKLLQRKLYRPPYFDRYHQNLLKIFIEKISLLMKLL